MDPAETEAARSQLPLARVQGWVKRNAAPLGVPLGALFIVLLLMLGLPIGPPVLVTGVVEQLGQQVRSSPVAFVRLQDGRLIVASLAYYDRCRTGDVIHLVQQRRLLGTTAKSTDFPCAPPAPLSGSSSPP